MRADLQVTTMGGNKYFLTFIDANTEMFHILTCKSEVFGMFKRLKVTVELQYGYSIKKLRSDTRR